MILTAMLSEYFTLILYCQTDHIVLMEKLLFRIANYCIYSWQQLQHFTQFVECLYIEAQQYCCYFICVLLSVLMFCCLYCRHTLLIDRFCIIYLL